MDWMQGHRRWSGRKMEEIEKEMMRGMSGGEVNGAFCSVGCSKWGLKEPMVIVQLSYRKKKKSLYHDEEDEDDDEDDASDVSEDDDDEDDSAGVASDEEEEEEEEEGVRAVTTSSFASSSPSSSSLSMLKNVSASSSCSSSCSSSIPIGGAGAGSAKTLDEFDGGAGAGSAKTLDEFDGGGSYGLPLNEWAWVSAISTGLFGTLAKVRSVRPPNPLTHMYI